MDSLADILASFEKTLEMESETGVRVVDCDRSLLSPPSVQSPVVSEASAEPSSMPQLSHPASDVSETGVLRPVCDFACIIEHDFEGEAKSLFANILAAMQEDVSSVPVIVAAPEARPRARAYIVFGSKALRAFAPGLRAACGTWTDVDGVPTMVTRSPDIMISSGNSDPAMLRSVKTECWRNLVSVLSRLGRKPVSPKKKT